MARRRCVGHVIDSWTEAGPRQRRGARRREGGAANCVFGADVALNSGDFVSATEPKTMLTQDEPEGARQYQGSGAGISQPRMRTPSRPVGSVATWLSSKAPLSPAWQRDRVGIGSFARPALRDNPHEGPVGDCELTLRETRPEARPKEADSRPRCRSARLSPQDPRRACEALLPRSGLRPRPITVTSAPTLGGAITLRFPVLVEPTEYLTDVLPRIRDATSDEQLDTLLPDRWAPLASPL